MCSSRSAATPLIIQSSVTGGLATQAIGVHIENATPIFIANRISGGNPLTRCIGVQSLAGGTPSLSYNDMSGGGCAEPTGLMVEDSAVVHLHGNRLFGGPVGTFSATALELRGGGGVVSSNLILAGAGRDCRAIVTGSVGSTIIINNVIETGSCVNQNVGVLLETDGDVSLVNNIFSMQGTDASSPGRHRPAPDGSSQHRGL